jgi:hypothetical protein
MQRCKQMSDIANNGVKYQSESSDKEYSCFAFRLNDIDVCDCVSFVMNRNKEAKRLGLKERGISAAGLASDCKHLRQIRKVTCQWTQKSESEYRYDETCPQCGGPVVEEGTKMIPEGISHDSDHVDDLKAMLAELKGSPEPGEVIAQVEADEWQEADQDAAEVAAVNDMSDDLSKPPTDRRHGTLPDDPSEWIEDLIASRNGVIPTGDDWKQLRELWGPVYGKRKIDAAYKDACSPDAVMARTMITAMAELALPEEETLGPVSLEQLEAESTVVHDEDDPKVRLEKIREAIHAENISYGEIAELQGLVEHIEPHDAELLEWAGVSEEDYRAGLKLAEPPDTWRCGTCGVEHPTESARDDCEYDHASNGVLAAWAVEKVLKATFHPNIVDELLKDIRAEMNATQAESPPAPLSLVTENTPQAAAARLATKVRPA